MSNVLQKLTEGIVSRNVSKEGEALLNKWSKTGLLEGIESEHGRQAMASLLENQAKELLRESNSMAGGSVEGFASVAFPIVRRVFGGLLANDLVSVQPMSLPSGLIFFLDFTHGTDRGPYSDGLTTDDPPVADTANPEQSIYGGGVKGKEIAGGVTDITESGFYSLSQGYSAARADTTLVKAGAGKAQFQLEVDPFTLDAVAGTGLLDTTAGNAATVQGQLQAIDYDVDLIADAQAATNDNVYVLKWGDGTAKLGVTSGITAANKLAMEQFVQSATTSFHATGITNCTVVRRLTKATFDADGEITSLRVVFTGTGDGGAASAGAVAGTYNLVLNAASATDDLGLDLAMSFAIDDNFSASGHAMGALGGLEAWELEGQTAIPEIDIKVDSVAITAQTRKLKAKWTPELGQDLNAYHNLDAEVELTSVLSEQIALEIDQEILGDLLKGATAGKRFWSKLPGTRLDSVGTAVNPAMDFTGSVSEWYETLIETINDVSADIHRKTLRGGANFVVCGPEVANVLEFTSGFRASVTHDADRGTIGGYKDGSINKKWDLYVDPYFPRNAVLVGRKGSSFLESGYVYAPYVPLQTTPTIFGPDDFVPRKGVMTRYGKKMVRPDMYGVVVVRDM
jgi:hypothetical protein